MPEPTVTELLVSYTDRLTVCPDRSIEFGNLKLQQRGLTLMWDEPQGKSLYIVITSVSSDRSLVMIGARGEWEFTIDVLRQIGDLMVSIRKLDCRLSGDGELCSFTFSGFAVPAVFFSTVSPGPLTVVAC